VPSSKIAQLIKEFHSKVFKGHYFDYTIVEKIMQGGYYWPTMFQEAFGKSKSYEKC